MAHQKLQRDPALFWSLVRSQHGIVSRAQLLKLGFGPDAIKHRIANGRLHPLWRGVYAVGRPEVSREGLWLAAVLCCGPRALLSHRCAAVLWGIVPAAVGIDVVVPEGVYRRRQGIRVHRRTALGPEHRRLIMEIPVTDPLSTLVDLASCGSDRELERAINEADRLDLANPAALRTEVDSLPPRPGQARIRRLLGCAGFTASGLERRFLALVRAAGLPEPETQAWVNGFRVDFYWPAIALVVEADGWRYHRTPAAQATDHRRDQAHTAAGLTTLRFAEAQVRFEPNEVTKTLATVAARLGAAPHIAGRRSS